MDIWFEVVPFLSFFLSLLFSLSQSSIPNITLTQSFFLRRGRALHPRATLYHNLTALSLSPASSYFIMYTVKHIPDALILYYTTILPYYDLFLSLTHSLYLLSFLFYIPHLIRSSSPFLTNNITRFTEFSLFEKAKAAAAAAATTTAAAI